MESATRAHLNLVESSRQLFELDPVAEVEIGEGWLFGAGSFDHAAITNTAIRTVDDLDPGELIERARGFFGPRERAFCIWARSGVDSDRELAAACEAAGIVVVYEMPEMILERRAEEPALAEGVAIRRIEEPGAATEYWRIAAAAYSELGFPAGVFDQYTAADGLLADNLVAFFGDVEGEPAAIALTIVSDGVAGIYWVGSLPTARGMGLGRAVTAAAVNAGFDLGADIASLQASPLGQPIYEAMGFRTIYDYRLLACPAP